MLISNVAGAIESYALTVYKEVTKYHLDMGVIHIWGTGSSKETATYQNGLAYGGEYNFAVTIEFPKEIQRVEKAYILDESSFVWKNNGIYSFNETSFLKDAQTYRNYYLNHVSSSIKNIVPTLVDSKTVKLSYKARLKSEEDYDLAEGLRFGNFNIIIDLLGGKDKVKPDLYEILKQGAENGVGPGVYGYIFFIPIVIEYQVLETVQLEEGDFIADLDAPASAKPGEEFEVVDASVFSDEYQFALTRLYYSVDGGSEKPVPGWKGTSLGESITQSFPSECTVTYTISVWNNLGTEKRASKTVVIVDEYDIEINADLELPEYTYEGHTEIANDQSTFVVDGVDYSASRAYAEGIAKSSYRTNSSTVSVRKINDTKAECTFTKAGTYNVTLDVKAGRARGSDTESIEVRKTPYIIDNLTGVQKQNRKQILNITVATYPGKPLTDYSITLKDKMTGDLIRLTPDNPQENTAAIKTRAVAMTQDTEKGFAYITLEFLTKTPSYYSTGTSLQDFYYEIHVTDSKGDTDTASKTFSVMPDLPPEPAISIDTVFLRIEGTNIASIQAEDVTVAVDGDSVERSWFYGATTAPAVFTDVSTMPGYKKLSFGTDKIVGFDRTGVGKFTVKLAVKEVWTEPTLEEYVSDSDRLTGETVAYSEVQNVAPIVSLELLSGKDQEILLLANNDAEFQTLLNKKTELQQALLANKIDGQIIIKKLVGNTPGTVTGVQQVKALTYPYPAKLRKDGLATSVDEGRLLAIDSEKTYFLTYTWIDGEPTVPKTIHAIKNFEGNEVWSYTTNRNEDFIYGQDDVGKYLYLIYNNSNQTVLLDKRTGAVAGTIDMALSDKIWLFDNLSFMVENNALYAVDFNSLQKIKVADRAEAVSRVGGNLQFIEKTDSAVVRCTLSVKNLEIVRDTIINAIPGVLSAKDYIPVCIDSTGKAVLYKHKGAGTDSFQGIRAYSIKNELVQEMAQPQIYYTGRDLATRQVLPSFDEYGVCNHILIAEWPFSQKNSIRFIGLDLVNKRSAALSGGDFTMNYAGAFQSGNTSYFMYTGWYIYPGGLYYCTNNYTYSFNGSSLNRTTTVPAVSGTHYAENIKVADRAFAALFGNNAPSTGTFDLRIIGFPRTLAQEAAEIISRFTGKLTFLGDINTTADQIKAAVEAPKPAVKIAASKDGYLYLNSLPLLPGKKYYYEYEIKSLTEGVESKLTGISAATGTVTSGESFLNDTLYVVESYEEKFDDTDINPFFRVDDPGCIADGYYGNNSWYPNPKGYGALNGDPDVGMRDSYMKLSFTVPQGRYATVTFDSSLYFNNWYRRSNYAGTNVFIDGIRVSEKVIYGNNWGEWNSGNRDYQMFQEYKTGRLFHKLLGPGTHTIECKVSANSNDWEYVLIDNLRVDILSTSPRSYSATYNKQDGDGGWLEFNGSFEVPSKVISYGAQAVTSKHYGALPSEVVKYYYYSKKGTYHPQITNYYQTVPSGYLQKGRVHLTSTTLRSYNDIKYTIHDVNTFTYDARNNPGWSVNEWVDLGTKTAGTYTHTVENGTPEESQGYLDVFELITFPQNSVTITGNIAFNDDNTKYYFPKVTSSGTTSLSMSLPKGEYLIKNLKIYFIENGRKVYLQNKTLDDIAELAGLTLSSGLTASNYLETPPEEEDEPIKIYKKGEKVLYNIFYDDYEEDPSKRQFWRYEHINWPPDGLHPDAGKILNAPIDRFYLSGKYTVTHWQQDNTQRPGTVGDATPYNKESNKVNLTFYVNGEGAAPWITYIKTNPSVVRENNTYTLAVGVDDSEKDTLTLETEVYYNGTSIFTHLRENLQANSAGEYPETLISGLPASKVGIYQVICTVRDWSGTGLGSYRFTVVSEGKVTGFVNHTDQWDENRKRYNLKRFGEEVNRPMSLDDYLAMPVPRMRGINVFWSGEKFILRAETEGEPEKVDVRIQTVNAQGVLANTGYIAELSDTGRKSTDGADIWEGSLWSDTMINKWGRQSPEPLYFLFTAYYAGGAVRTSEAMVIIDSRTDYWQLHRLW